MQFNQYASREIYLNIIFIVQLARQDEWRNKKVEGVMLFNYFVGNW